MRFGWAKTIFVVCLSLVFSGWAFAQANINENLETAYLWVDVVNGNDNNPGTEALPFKTIGKGVEVSEQNNHQGIGTRVTINPGLYRENIHLLGTMGETKLPETFEAATPGTVFITGADQYTSWTPYSQNNSIYTTPWPYKFGFCPALGGTAPYQEQIVLRTEMAYVNGTPLTQVLSLDQMVANTLFVDESAGLFYIWPPAGTDLSTADVELADRPVLWRTTDKDAVVLRGLTFEYSPDCIGDAAVETYAGHEANIEFDTDSFLWNNATGLRLFIPTFYYTVQNIVANHNGEKGVTVYQTANGLWQNIEGSYNNWRGAQGGFYTWASGGIYEVGEHTAAYSNLTFDFNESLGMHIDTNNENFSISGIAARYNFSDGLMFEKNDGPVSATNGTLCYNATSQIFPGDVAEGGFELRDSDNSSLTQSILYGNGTTSITVQGIPGGFNIQDWQNGQTYNVDSRNFVNTGNTFVSLQQPTTVFADANLGGQDWTNLQSTLTSNYNTWWNPQNSTTPFEVPYPNDETYIDFPTWQSLTGQDANSTFSEPNGNVSDNCAVTPDIPDYWFWVNFPTQNLDAAGNAVYNLSSIPLDFSGTLSLSLYGVNAVPGLSASLSANSIPANGAATLALNATTSIAPGSYPLTVIATSGDITRAVTFSLIVPQTSVRLSADQLSFGNQQVNTNSAPQTVTFTNFGASPVSISSISIFGNGYTQTNNCPTSVLPQQSCTVSVTFSPPAIQNFSAQLLFADSDPTSPQSVSLSGAGVPPAYIHLSSNSLNFAPQVYQTPSAPEQVTITNIGSVPVVFTSFTIGGNDPNDFSQSNNCPSTLPVGQSCTVTVIFTPQALETRQAVLQILDNTQSGAQYIYLKGQGITAVRIRPGFVDFGVLTLGKKAFRQVTLYNSGNALPISSITITGSGRNGFSQINTCGTMVLAGGSCVITVTFDPGHSIVYGATLEVADTDPASPQEVTLVGVAVLN